MSVRQWWLLVCCVPSELASTRVGLGRDLNKRRGALSLQQCILPNIGPNGRSA